MNVTCSSVTRSARDLPRNINPFTHVDPTPYYRNPPFTPTSIVYLISTDPFIPTSWSQTSHILYDVATRRYRRKELMVIVFRLEDIDLSYSSYNTSCFWNTLFFILTNTFHLDTPTRQWETLIPKDKDHLLDLPVMESTMDLCSEVTTLETSLLLYVRYLLHFLFRSLSIDIIVQHDTYHGFGLTDRDKPLRIVVNNFQKPLRTFDSDINHRTLSPTSLFK